MSSKRPVKRQTTTARAKSANAASRRAAGKAANTSRPPREHSEVQRQAAGFSKTRADHSQEIAEDYVEIIARLSRDHGEARTVDIAKRLGVSHVTVTKTVARLQREGLVHSEKYRSIFLTDSGVELAEKSEQRHRLVVAFLEKLGVPSEYAEADAEGIEHHVSEATLAAIQRFVQNG